MQGIISNYDPRSNPFGFIDCEELKTEVFFHKSSLPPEERKRRDLAGAVVTFDLGTFNDRPVATNIVLDPASSFLVIAASRARAQGGKQ